MKSPDSPTARSWSYSSKPKLAHRYHNCAASTASTFYKWRSKFGGMDASPMSQYKELQDENLRLKKIYADAQLSAELLKEAVAKIGEASQRRRAVENGA